MKFTTVTFDGDEESVMALYIDGELHDYGDWYHDKINVKISSFIDGVRFSMVDVDEEKIECKNKELITQTTELGYSPPMKLSDITD
jgi:hypothetical protein